MASLNMVQLIGNLGRDPEVRSFPNGGKVVNLRLATSETWKDKTTGEKKERVEWHSVAIFNEGLAKVAEQYLRKGSSIYIAGQLETRKWQDQTGADRYTTEIVLRPYNGALVMLGGRGDGSGSGSDQRDSGSGAGYGSGSNPTPAGAGRPDLDDEIPF